MLSLISWHAEHKQMVHHQMLRLEASLAEAAGNAAAAAEPASAGEAAAVPLQPGTAVSLAELATVWVSSLCQYLVRMPQHCSSHFKTRTVDCGENYSWQHVGVFLTPKIGYAPLDWTC